MGKKFALGNKEKGYRVIYSEANKEFFTLCA